MRCFFFASMPTLLSASSQHNSYPPQSSYKLDQNDNIFAKSLVDVIDAGGKKYYTVPTCWKSTIQVLRQWHLDHKEEDVSPPHSNSSFDFCSTLTEKDRKKVRKKDKSMPEVVVSKPVVAYQPSPRSWCTCWLIVIWVKMAALLYPRRAMPWKIRTKTQALPLLIQLLRLSNQSTSILILAFLSSAIFNSRSTLT